MARITTEEERTILREAGRRAARIMEELAREVRPGVTTDALEEKARALMRREGVAPALLGYHPEFAPRPYPAALCVAVNEVVVHGIPTEEPYTLREGDIIGIDFAVSFRGMVVDMARTFGVGAISPKARHLLAVTRRALRKGIAAARAGAYTGDIGNAIASYVRAEGLSVVEVLAGHGVGRAVHEPPEIPNFGVPGQGTLLTEGMVLAIEPMVNTGSKEVVFSRDGYTVRTRDGSLSAHFEDTVLVTAEGPEVLTRADT